MAEIQTVILYSSLFISLFFEVFLLITYLEVRNDLKEEAKHLSLPLKSFPSVTIIVPSYNEESTVAATIKSLLKLDYPKNKLSFILIDDGSKDRTLKILNKFKKIPQIKIFSKQNEGSKYSAMNFGLERVESDLVGCLDADSFVNPDALRKIVPFFEDAKTMAVTPSIRVHEPKSILQYVQKIEYNWGIFLRRMLSSMGALYVTPGPFSIFRTQVFRDLGGYRKGHHTEDLEIALRMQKNHYKIVNSHGAHVFTKAPAQLPALYKQRVRWTYGFLNNAFDYRQMFFNKKYGNIGIFILPIATSSIFSTLYMTGRFVINNIKEVADAFIRYRTVGFDWNWSTPTFDWYFINTGVVPFLTFTTIAMILAILFLSIRLAEGKFQMTRGILYYLVLYVFIVPLWLTKAVFSTLFRREVSWR